MNRNMMNCYQVRNMFADDALLDMLHDSSVAVTKYVQCLRDTGTEVEALKQIQRAIVLMCAAIQVFAPDMIDFEYSSAANKVIESWKSNEFGGIQS